MDAYGDEDSVELKKLLIEVVSRSREPRLSEQGVC